MRRVIYSTSNSTDLTLYHGSNDPNLTIESIDLNHSAEPGLHVGTKDQATNVINKKYDGKGYLYEVILKNHTMLELNQDLDSDWGKLQSYIDSAVDPNDALLKYNGKRVRPSDIPEIMVSCGYDSASYPNKFEGSGDSLVVFNKSVIKSIKLI